MTVKCMAGIDLHSNNLFCAIVDMEGKRVFEQKLPCDLESVLQALKPFKKRLEKIAVESTYNWYWLVDGLQDHGYPVVLANPAAMRQYDGLKHADDKSDGFFLAEMLRLNILPTGYICDRTVRPVRDLLRRRMGLVHKRTSLILSLKSLHMRMTGRDLGTGRIKAMEPKDAEKLFEHPADQLITRLDLQLVEQLGQSIEQIEAAILATVKRLPDYQVLQTMPGVGKILGLTITLETVDPKRFASPGDYASYCRCVGSRRMSNGKKKGENNEKCGNKYLAWAFVEAANFAQRHDAACRKFYDRKKAQINGIVATKALACKLAKAAWHMMSGNTPYDSGRMFPAARKQIWGERRQAIEGVGAKPGGLIGCARSPAPAKKKL
jgi:transposase